LTLLVGLQEEHPACKHWVMRCWCGCLSGARCRLFAYGPAGLSWKRGHWTGLPVVHSYYEIFVCVCVIFLYILVTSFIGQVDYIINVMYDCTRWHMCVLLLLVILDIFTNIEDIFTIRGKVLSWEYRFPRKRNSRPSSTNHSLKLSYYLFIITKLFKVKDGCLKFVYIGKKSRFTVFLDINLHTRLAIVTENELGLAFPPRTFTKNSSRSVHVLFSYRCNKQTEKPTPVKT